MSVFIIAEAGSSHDNDLQKAYRLIEAAKECGADAVKFQWTSSGADLAARRGLGGDACHMYQKYLEKPVSWLESLKAHCDKVGVEFMCTVYLIEDIATIAPLVKRFKVSAFESQWYEFINAHGKVPLIVSHNGESSWASRHWYADITSHLYCVSQYPTKIDDLKLDLIKGHCECYPDGYDKYWGYDGLSDHTANVLTGAAAVAAGAKIVEAHIRLASTNENNPDYPHSLLCDMEHLGRDAINNASHSPFAEYVRNIRTVERML